MQDPFYSPTSIGTVVTAAPAANAYTASIAAQAFDMTATAVLPPGVWLLIASGVGYMSTSPNAGGIAPVVTIRDTTNLADVASEELLITNTATPAIGDSNYFTYFLSAVMTCKKNTSIKVVGGSRSFTGSPTTGGYGSRANGTGLVCVKLANVP